MKGQCSITVSIIELQNELVKKFQGENSVVEGKQLLEIVVYDGKNGFAVRRCGRSQDQKTIPSLKCMTPK